MRKIAFICFDKLSILDLTGPMQIFSSATKDGEAEYKIEIISTKGGMISCSAGLMLKTHPLKELDGFDSLIVVGGLGVSKASTDTDLIRYIEKQTAKVSRVISICTGSFLLAKTGILKGKSATTHWGSLDRLAEENPKTRVASNAFYIRDGNVITSAGVTAGMDLALSLVEEDLGHDVAIRIAKSLLMFYNRSGGQAQFSDKFTHDQLPNHKFHRLCSEIRLNPKKDYSVPLLADHMNMSVRHFSRLFTKDVGLSPAKYVEITRLEAAKCRLENGAKSLAEVSESCGFGSEEVLRRVFIRNCSITPTQYCERYSRLISAGEY